MKKLVSSFVVTVFLFASTAQADKSKEFFMSVVYGTLAGTLVGAATLAFTANPGDNLNNVSRGASYGLYAGILLGVYINYALDDSAPEKPAEDEEKVNTPVDDSRPLPSDSENESHLRFKLIPKAEFKMSFVPFVLTPSLLHPGWGGGVRFLEMKF